MDWKKIKKALCQRYGALEDNAISHKNLWGGDPGDYLYLPCKDLLSGNFFNLITITSDEDGISVIIMKRDSWVPDGYAADITRSGLTSYQQIIKEIDPYYSMLLSFKEACDHTVLRECDRTLRELGMRVAAEGPFGRKHWVLESDDISIEIYSVRVTLSFAFPWGMFVDRDGVEIRRYEAETLEELLSQLVEDQ